MGHGQRMPVAQRHMDTCRHLIAAPLWARCHPTGRFISSFKKKRKFAIALLFPFTGRRDANKTKEEAQAFFSPKSRRDGGLRALLSVSLTAKRQKYYIKFYLKYDWTSLWPQPGCDVTTAKQKAPGCPRDTTTLSRKDESTHTYTIRVVAPTASQKRHGTSEDIVRHDSRR